MLCYSFILLTNNQWKISRAVPPKRMGFPLALITLQNAKGKTSKNENHKIL
jgi:hypothetical protein